MNTDYQDLCIICGFPYIENKRQELTEFLSPLILKLRVLIYTVLPLLFGFRIQRWTRKSYDLWSEGATMDPSCIPLTLQLEESDNKTGSIWSWKCNMQQNTVSEDLMPVILLDSYWYVYLQGSLSFLTILARIKWESSGS